MGTSRKRGLLNFMLMDHCEIILGNFNLSEICLIAMTSNGCTYSDAYLINYSVYVAENICTSVRKTNQIYCQFIQHCVLFYVVMKLGVAH